jgi:hypothetical protein
VDKINATVPWRNTLIPYDLNQSHLGHDLNKRHLNRSSQRSRRKFVIPPEAVKNGPSDFVRGFLIAFKHPKSFEQKHAEPAKAPCGVLAA